VVPAGNVTPKICAANTTILNTARKANHAQEYLIRESGSLKSLAQRDSLKDKKAARNDKGKTNNINISYDML
jgi:hypothetical protein